MREILFRGKTEEGEWIEGLLAYCNFNHGIEKAIYVATELGSVIPYRTKQETVGQYTGLKDKNGKKIFEGDIVYIRFGHGNCVVGKAIVYFDEKLLQYRVKEIKPYAYDSEVGDLYKDCDFTHIDECEVIGNIHDNPELMEGKQ